MAASRLDSTLLHRLDRFALVSRKRVSRSSRGDRRSAQKGHSLNFIDYRQYTPGDEIDQIDWNVYGRLDTLMVKLFEDEQNVPVHILVDNSLSMDWGEPNKLRLALDLAEALGYVALSNFDRLFCATFSDVPGATFGPAANQREAPALFAFLEAVKAAGETDFAASLRRYASQNRQPGLAIVISDLLSHAGFEVGLKHLLERRYEVMLVQTLAPAEVHPVVGGDMKLIDRENRRAVDITLNQRAVNLYHERYAAWTATIERFCARHRILYERVETSMPLESILFRGFRQRGLIA